MNSKKSKIVSIIIATVILLTSGIIFGKAATKANAGDAVLQQYDSEWGSYPYGDGTLGDSGCGAFAIINAVRYLTGNTMDIYAVADWGSANEYIWGVGSSFSIAPDAAAKFGSTYGFQLDTHYGFSEYVGSSYPATQEAYDAAWNMLVSKLSQGEVAVGLVHNHFISIVDYDSSTDRVLVYDPGAGSKRQTSISGDWKTHDELNYWSDAGTEYLKLRAYLTFYFATGASAPSATETSPAFNGSDSAAGTYVVTTGGSELNLRAYASTSSAILYAIPNGAEVQVIESDGSWASIIYNGISGYCSTQYLTIASQTTDTDIKTTSSVTTTTVTATTTSALSEEKSGTYIVSADGSYLNMREGIGTQFNIVAQIPDESKVTVISANDEWAAVTWNDSTGYCSMAYLKKADITSITSSSDTSESEYETTLTTTVTVSSEENTVPTETTSNLTETYIATDTKTSSDTDVAGAYRVNANGSHLNLRAKNSTDADILSQIPDNSEVFVISIDDEWANISWKDIVGYCKAEYLEKTIIDAEQSTDDISDIDPAYLTSYGDINIDGDINMSDVVLLHKALTGAISLNKTSAANADCYLDGKLNIVDATVIIQYIIDNCSIPIMPAVF